jgi:endonuclease YncB( thermonuclease family)
VKKTAEVQLRVQARLAARNPVESVSNPEKSVANPVKSVSNPGSTTSYLMQTLNAASVALVLALLVAVCPQASGAPLVYRVDHVVDGDTIALRNGQRVRLVQIDTPEVFFGTECYGRAASAQTKGLLPAGSRVRLFAEPA